MIEVVENAAFPYQTQYYTRMGWNVQGRDCGFTLGPEFRRSRIDADYLSQGRHDHATGWSGVIHAKANGVVNRYSDGSIPRIAETDRSRIIPNDYYVYNGIMCANPVRSYDPCVVTSLGTPCVVTQFTQSGNKTSMKIWGACYYLRDDGKIRVAGRYKSETYTFDDKDPTKSRWSGGQGVTKGCPSTTVSKSWTFDDYVANSIAAIISDISHGDGTGTVGTSSRYTCGARAGEGQYLTDGEIIRLARKELFSLAMLGHDVQSENRGELQAQSFDEINRFDSNMLALCGDLKNIGRSSVSVLTNLMSASKNPRKLAAAWLSARYGDKLTIGDLQSLFAGFSRSAWRHSRNAKYLRGRSRRTISVQYHDANAVIHLSTQIAIVPKDYNGLMKSVRRAYEWDYYPSLGNVWDLIPLSFVVDWFVDVSNIFEDLDRLVQARYYDVTCVLETVKVMTTCNSLKGVDLSYYDRSIGKQLSLGMSSVQLGLPSAINIVDGVSLLLM